MAESSLLQRQTEHNEQLIKINKALLQEKKEWQQRSAEQQAIIQNLQTKIDNLEQDKKIMQSHTNQLIQQLEDRDMLLLQADEEITTLKQILQAYQQPQQQFPSFVQETTLDQSLQQQATDVYNQSKIFSSRQVRLFEEFFIITGQREMNQPSVIFQHPVDQNQVAGLLQQLPLFCYPWDLQSQSLGHSDIVRLLQNDIHQQWLQIFTPSKASGEVLCHPFLKDCNSDQWLFAIVVAVDDFIAEKKAQTTYEIVNLKKQGLTQRVQKSQMVYVFLTYFPLISLFNDCIGRIVKNSHNERLTRLPAIVDLREIDQYYFLQQEDKLRNYLDVLFELECPPKQFPLYDRAIQTPKVLRPYLYQFQSAPLSLFNGWNAQNIIDIVCALLTECKVVIQGFSKQQISYLMLFFAAAIRPIQYIHPFILNLPPSLYPLVDAPVPVFLGVPGPLLPIEDCVLVNAQNTPVKILFVYQYSYPSLQSQLQVQIDKIHKLAPPTQSTLLQHIDNLLSILQSFLEFELLKGNSNDKFTKKVKETQLYQQFSGHLN